MLVEEEERCVSMGDCLGLRMEALGLTYRVLSMEARPRKIEICIMKVFGVGNEGMKLILSERLKVR